MTNNHSNKRIQYKIRIDHSLDKYERMVLFPNKLEAANKTLEKVGLPKRKLRPKRIAS